MIEGNLAYDIIDEIPWDDSPQFAFSRDSAKYCEAFRKVVERLPEESGERINFFADTWDFTPYFENRNSIGVRLVFDGLASPLKRYCKFYCIHEMMGRSKVSTVGVRLGCFRSVALNVMKRTGHDSPLTITTQDVIDEVSRRGVGASTEHNLYLACWAVLSFVKNNYRIPVGVDLKEIHRRQVAAKEIARARKDDTKLPNIPADFYDATLAAAIACMRDDGCELNMRAMACEIVMLSQLGMRIGDLVALRIGDLAPYQLGNGAKAGFIRYRTQKASRAHQPMLELETFSDPLCTEAFETLLDIRPLFASSAGHDFLYTPDLIDRGVHRMPVSLSTFREHYKKFFGACLPELCRQDWDGLERRKTYVPDDLPVRRVNKLGRMGKPARGHYERLSVPDTRQFRVHVCTALYEGGFSLAYIQRYMGHLSEYMMGYYVRPKDTYQESISYCEDVIRQVAGEGLDLIGGSFPTQLTAAIRDFVKADRRDLAAEIGSIANDLGKTIAIRAKPGGVCIKADGVLGCAKDGRTDQVLCLNGVCPNIYHLVPDVAIAYEDFKVMQQTYQENLENGFERQAQMELSKLKRKNKLVLLPELAEMDKVIAERGEEWLAIRHPELLDIITRRDEIRGEALAWMIKK